MFRLLLLTLALLAIAPGASPAQESFDDLSRTEAEGSDEGRSGPAQEPVDPEAAATLPLSKDGAPLEVLERYGKEIRFVPGRDNPAFPNLSGAIRAGGMEGNCYTMAFVTKLFFEGARYEPDAREEPGFSLGDLSTHLGGSREAPFTVRGFASLHDMTDDPEFGESEAFEQIRHSRGLASPAEKAPPPLTDRRRAVVQLMQFITTVHYLHYLQYQGGAFLEAMLRPKLAGAGGIAKMTQQQLVSIGNQLQSGKTCLLLMFNPAVTFGHVVLAYGMQSTSKARYVFVCDSNIQCRGETRHSVLEVSHGGRVTGLFLREPDGSLVRDTRYEHEWHAWFKEMETLAVVHLEDFPLSTENLRKLAGKTAAADEETAYLVAGGQLLSDLTGRSPAQSSLREDLLRFLVNVQEIQESLGYSFISKAEELSGASDVASVNRFLEKHADFGIRTAYPHALPEGISVTDTRVELDARDANRAYLTTTISLAAKSPVESLGLAIHRSAFLADDRDLEGWVRQARRHLGSIPVKARLALELRKQRMPSGFETEYGLMPVLLGSHLVVGDIEPTPKRGLDHQLEVSEEAVRAGLRTALGKLDLIGKSRTVSYVLIPAVWSPGWIGDPVQLTPDVWRDITLRLDAVSLDLMGRRGPDRGYIQLDANCYAFVRCNPLDSDLGISVTAEPLTIELEVFDPGARNRSEWAFQANGDGDLVYDDGLLNVAVSMATLLDDVIFPHVRDALNSGIEESLKEYVELERRIEIDSLDLTGKSVTFETNEARADVAKLARKLFNLDTPVFLRHLEVMDDRIVFGASQR